MNNLNYLEKFNLSKKPENKLTIQQVLLILTNLRIIIKKFNKSRQVLNWNIQLKIYLFELNMEQMLP